MNIGAIGQIFSGLMKGLDGLLTSDEERLLAKGQIMQVQNQVMTSVLEYEKSLIEEKSKIITAEAQGESWIQRNWRPVTMLTFVGLVVLRWMGVTTDNITPEIESELMLLIQIGLGGYVAGRSGEKIVKALDLGNKSAKD